MTYSILRTIRAFAAPQHKLSCSRGIWYAAVRELARRGAGRRESGAFLLGGVVAGRREVRRVVYYDDLDPHCLDHGIITFDGSGFAKLWKICRESGLEVLADVHTHQLRARQSPTDRDNPMMAHPGHIAIILPNYATGRLVGRDIGLYIYKGSFTWEDCFGDEHILYRGRWA
jgi:proteasome lid subunit RPN8/RPN11